MIRSGYWFVPKRFGLGATPVTWQGWAITLGSIALILAILRFVPSDMLKLGLIVPLLAGFVALAWIKTDGAWRFRWGDREP